jgi:hypothetical protein
MGSAEYWLFPSNWEETSCITALEMLYSEVICIYYPIDGLVNTMENYGILMEKNNEINTLLSIVNDEKRKKIIRNRGKEYASKCTWKNRMSEWSTHLF